MNYLDEQGLNTYDTLIKSYVRGVMSERSEIPSSLMAVINGIDGNVSDIKSNYVTTTALTNALANIGGNEVITITHSNGTGSAHVEVKSGDTVLNANVASGGTVSVPFGIEYTIYAYDANGLVVDKVTKIAARYSSSYSFDLTVTGVDLGLPSGKIWATKNVGAANSNATGTYFFWADFRNNISVSEFNSTDHATSHSYRAVSATFKSGDLFYDAARYNMGGDWRTPTAGEMLELLTKCQQAWSNSGATFTGPNGNTIFFPKTGYLDGGDTKNTSNGYYWTTTPYVTSYSGSAMSTSSAFSLYVGQSLCYMQSSSSWRGLPVRAIRDPK